MPFTNLLLETIDDKPGFFKVAEETTYFWNSTLSRYDVEEGFETDLASIPAFMRIFFSKVGVSRKPAVFHDHMYENKWKTRKACDKIFKRMLKERGMGRFQVWCFYRGVRAFGWTRGNW